MTHFSGSTLEETALEWLRDLGYSVVYGNDITSKNMQARLRYSLLPSLMRGKVRVKDVEV